LEFCKQFDRDMYDDLTALSDGENLFPLITHCKLEDTQNDFATKDLATAAINESLLSPVELGDSLNEEFITQHIIVAESQDNPSVSFSSRLHKVSVPTFANLYDVALEKSKKAEAAELISFNQNILQCLVTSYDAK
jgi:hypothetical protein